MVAVKMVFRENRRLSPFEKPYYCHPIYSPFTVLVVLECFSSEGGYLLSSSPCMSVSLQVKESERGK